MKRILLLIWYIVLLILYTTFSYILDCQVYRLVFKLLLSSTFVGIGIYSYIKDKKLIHFFALIGCLLGDLFLGIQSFGNGKLMVILGLVSFLIAHILFITSLFKTARIKWYELVFPLCMVLAVLGLSFWPKLPLGGMLPWVLIYAFFVTWFFTRSLVVYQNNKNINTLLYSIAALMFFLSDLDLLFVMFYQGPFIIGPLLNAILYFGSMYLLAMRYLLFPEKKNSNY